MKIISIVILGFIGTIASGWSLSTRAESVRSSQAPEVPKPKLENLQRRSLGRKIQQCNIQCITTPCPCNDKLDPDRATKQPDRGEYKDKFDR